MDPEEQRRIASMGGRAAHERGTAHQFSSDEAREAGRRGGESRSATNRGDLNRGNINRGDMNREDMNLDDSNRDDMNQR